MFLGVRWVGVKDVLGVSLAVGDVEGLDVGHGSEEADDCFVGVDVGHGFLGVGGVRMDAELFINDAFDAGLEAVFEAVFAGGDSIIYSAAGEVALSENEGVHFGVDGEVVLHWSFGESHFGFVGALEHAVITE